MRTLLVERRCPTCGSGDLLERFHAPSSGAFGLPVRPDDRDDSGRPGVTCEVEFPVQGEPVR